MIIVACLLLPVVALLLFGMDRVEEWVRRAPQPPRHARRLRWVRGGGRRPAAHTGGAVPARRA